MKKTIVVLLLVVSLFCSIISYPIVASTKGPVYYHIPIYNSCEIAGHQVIYGTISTSSAIDFSKTTLILHQPVDSTGAYLYYYEDKNGIGYIPYFDGYAYDDYAYYSGWCGGTIH